MVKPPLNELERAAEDLLAIEEATVSEVASILRSPVRRLIALLIAAWPGNSAPLTVRRRIVQRVNTSVLIPRIPEVRQVIKRGAREAQAHGLMWALREAEAAGVPSVRVPPSAYHVSARLHSEVDRLEQSARRETAKVRALLSEAATGDDVVAALTVLERVRHHAERVATTATNQAANDALTEVSRASDDLVSVWRAERDACLHCLAYQGQIDTGDGFKGGLTFDRKPLSDEPVESPPLHPNCRCTLWLVHKDAVGGLATALEREAKRSVLRGWSLESESETRRVEAAGRLLKRGTSLPKSVQDYARRAIRNGEFPRSRKPPT